ncbi:trigger factor [Patescibacteria group bacterium]|nr:trigger factor [Patescibacteria group bacterium]MBU1721301.1 trigger factor [Patescibacteria group bacterium]MBU1900823.1 trigger factor [Patescibacteria group bacterium]
MAQIKREDKATQVALTISIPEKEYTPALKRAAKRLSMRVAIKGFRKGHAPYELIKKEVGAMSIMQEALEDIIQEQYSKAVIAEKLETLGMPQINIEKLAPENDIVFKAEVALLPSITLPDFKKIKVEEKEVVVDDKKLDETLDAIRGMHATEVRKDGAAEGTDKLIIDMTMTQDGVVVEGGKTVDYQVYLGEDHYIPGFNKELVGAKKGETKEFSLSFPKTHYQKQLAGKKIDFSVVIKDVYVRELPTLTEEFAQKIGQDSVKALKALIKENLLNEAKQKASQQVEIEMLDQIIDQTIFSDIPDILLESEKNKIFHELKQDLSKHGVTIEQYLEDIKKKEDELRKEFSAQAEKRAKAALVSRQIAKEHNIVVSKEALEAEINVLKDIYKDNKDAQENLKRADVHDTIALTLQNKEVISWLKKQIITKKVPKTAKK